MYWILKAIFFNSFLYLKTTYLLSLIFFFLFSFFWIITCYFFSLALFFLIVVCWFFFIYFYQEWTTSFCLKCFGIKLLSLTVGPKHVPFMEEKRRNDRKAYSTEYRCWLLAYILHVQVFNNTLSFGEFYLLFPWYWVGHFFFLSPAVSMLF